MNSLLRKIVLLAALVAASPLMAQELAPLEATFAADRARMEMAVSGLQAAREEWDRAVAAVEVLRRRVVADPFVAAALPDALREAHEVASELTALDAQLRDAQRRLEASTRALRDAATARLVQIEASITQRGSATGAETAEIARTQALLDALGDPALMYSPPPLEAILGALDDDPDELRAVADELADHEARLERQLGEVRAGLERARARERLEERVSALAFEERFFDDGGFRRSAGTTRATSEATAGGAGGGTTSEGGATTNDGVGSDDLSAGGDRGSASSPDPGMPPAQEGAPEAPAFGEGNESDFDSAGGGVATPPRLDVVPVEATPNPGRLVDTTSASADPTLRGLAAETGAEPQRRRSRARTAELETLEQTLQRDLAVLRERRAQIEAQALEMERDER